MRGDARLPLDEIPYWIDDPRIDRDAHRLEMSRVGKGLYVATCPCGTWHQPKHWGSSANLEAFDRHIRTVQVSARRSICWRCHDTITYLDSQAGWVHDLPPVTESHDPHPLGSGDRPEGHDERQHPRGMDEE